MEFVLGVFTSLFSDDFVERHNCGQWHPFWIGVYASANLMTFLAYFLMARAVMDGTRFVQNAWGDTPGRLVLHLSKQERDRLFGSASMFILCCGIGHLDGVLSFFHATYHLYALWHACVAVVSMRALVVFVRDARRISPIRNA